MGTALLALSCTPAATGQPGATGEAQRTPQRTLVFISPGEPPNLTSKLGTGGRGAGVQPVFSRGFVSEDNQGVMRPILLETLPQPNTGTWRVFPDGQMEVTYTLRPGLTWHDGAPLTADDVVFAWRVYAVAEMGWNPTPQYLMGEVKALDDRTFLIRWKETTIRALRLDDSLGGFPPLPRHILGEIFSRGDPQALLAAPYWTVGFVGVGPYRLERWELGSFMEGTAFESYALGRPRIDRVRIVFGADPDAVLATLLAGGAHATLSEAIYFQHGSILNRQWEARGEGTVLVSPQRLSYLQVQFKPEFVSPRAILDVRVRKAIAYAVDKQALNEGLMDGLGQVADAFVSPQHPNFSEIDRVVTKYPHDPRRAEQFLAEAGLLKQPDGFYRSATGDPFDIQVQGQGEKELVLLIDAFRRAGVRGNVDVLSGARVRDREAQSTYPALAVQRNNHRAPLDLSFYDKFHSSIVATKENRWAGPNRGGYVHPEYERLFDLKAIALVEVESARLDISLAEFISEHLPGIPLYHEVRVDAQVSGLRGPTTYLGSRMWNLHEWEWIE